MGRLKGKFMFIEQLDNIRLAAINFYSNTELTTVQKAVVESFIYLQLD